MPVEQQGKRAGGENRSHARTAVKVAIVGGGCAGLAAAWQLSRLPGYQVSVYERSWRLGGKGASGRSADGRIHEHGLHVWLGFYENAFKMIRECYAEVGKRNWGPHGEKRGDRLAHATFEDAFFPEPHIGVTGKNSAGDQTVWSGFLPPEKGLPGDPLDADTNPFTLASYLLRCVALLKTLMLSVIETPDNDRPGKPRPETRSALDETVDLNFSFDPTRSPEILIEGIAGRLRDGTLTAAAAVLQAVTILENILQQFNHSPQGVGSALNLLKALAGQARKQLGDLLMIDEKLRWKAEIIEIVLTIAVGLYRDRVLFAKNGLDAINDLDYREWLEKHGATKTARESRFVTGIYDLVFAYEGGDRRRPRLAAGVALRGALRMFFTYRGSMFWRIRSGMGDAVFAPLYKVMTLPDRKSKVKGEPLPTVEFHFLHKLSKITCQLTPKERRFVTQLTFTTTGDRSRIVNPGDRALDDFGCWPDNPRLLQSEGGSGATGGDTVLNAGKDFDAVIFAIGRDEFPELLTLGDMAGAKTADMPTQWQALAERGQTVATKAAQVWLTSDLEQLGWYRGSAIISALGMSFDTWADMTHTLPSERAWREANDRQSVEADKARSVAYFCGVLPDTAARQGRSVVDVLIRENLANLLSKELRDLWPAAFKDGKTAADQVLGESHVQANTEGSDRYSLSLPGTIRDRLSPLDRTVLNMTVAGDWTACGLDAGCVEAAVMSGMLAAHAITGDEPTLESIIGYDHP